MKKRLITNIISLLVTCLVSSSGFAMTPTIGIVVPLEHPAMREIVNGFKQEIHHKYHKPIKIVVKNAQHDPTLERMIIQQMKVNQTTLIEPIGEDAFEMSLALVKTKPVLGIAAEFSDQARLKLKPRHASVVLDEVNPLSQLQMAKKMVPSLKHITLVHSADDKTLQEVKSVKKAAEKIGATLQDLTVVQPPDMYTISSHISPDANAVFVLKDHLIVSEMSVLVKQVEKFHIPVIASDDGSVKQGAAFAIGVPESSIGVAAADMTVMVLNGKSLGDIPIKKLTHYKLFLNMDTAAKQGIDVQKIKRVAMQLGLPVVTISTSKV